MQSKSKQKIRSVSVPSGVLHGHTGTVEGWRVGAQPHRCKICGFVTVSPGCSCVAVIPDSLQSTAVRHTLHRVEQDPLELTCEVATETLQHSHLSVAWLRQRGGEKPVEVIALSRDFVLQSSSDYAQRQSLGEVRLDKLGSSTFRLTVFHLQPSDQGEFYCEATEWIQDPDGSWYPMTRKRSEGTVVNVQPTGQSLVPTLCLAGRVVRQAVQTLLAVLQVLGLPRAQVAQALTFSGCTPPAPESSWALDRSQKLLPVYLSWAGGGCSMGLWFPGLVGRWWRAVLELQQVPKGLSLCYCSPSVRGCHCPGERSCGLWEVSWGI